MIKPRIGLISFSDGRKRVHDGLEQGILEHEARIAAAIAELGGEAVRADAVAYTPRMAVQAARDVMSADVAAVAFNIPVFAFPNLSVLAADVLEKPLVLLSPGEEKLPGMGGLLASGGAIEQVGYFHRRIWGPLTRPENRRKLEVFMRAAGARAALRGQVYGELGGRSIGMMTGVSSSVIDWHRTFGVDIDHVDQSEILRRAETIEESERVRIVEWLESNLGRVAYDEGSKLTHASLLGQAACAAAVKQIIAEREFDFVGIKCHYDLSEYYCTQCLSAAFLPSRLDWDGERESVVCACEADRDGAMSMQILQLLSGAPALFLDLRHYNEERELWTLCNCGGQSVHYSRRADAGADNLSSVELVPVIAKYGGTGAHVRYVGCAGPLTCARLMHDRDGMAILAFRGEAVDADPSWLEASCPSWPHLFVRADVDPHVLLNRLHANHIHAVEGDCIEELETFAAMLGLRFVQL